MKESSETENINGFLNAKQALTAHPNRWRKLRFNVASLDRLLCTGGISARGVVEISGDAGSGKTQLALHLALTCQQQCPERRGVVYISTEHPFPSKRLVQMEQALRNSSGVGHEVGKYSDNIFVEHLNSPSALEQCITDRLPVLLENNPIRLLVIDPSRPSIAAVYADEEDYVERAESFRRLVHSLHALQERFDFVTVCTNQVRAVVDDYDGEEKVIPALGLAWGSLVHTRIQLRRIMGTNRRVCQLVFCPTAEPAECYFVIAQAGILDAN
ncbi:LOW QUALITY PROTEIN: DNA repair protein XRCC3 [Culex quinquefasciatus]|uniref:LOW QUALITY PROTEIN: DNA repair protein XRCC3 n=1 Tax=Culex quinquefasciatus TaxID=7176 RepID=UPI0018E3D071|nr:LOW QUALITY PROTEIN: DNA repair protein XRCC3 [Culex quinquefasciatus]